MKIIVLAAGYATRLYPLTLNQPKPLLPIAGKPMIDHVLDKLLPIGGVDRVYVVTNNKFSTHFQKWADSKPASAAGTAIAVVNDHTTDESNRLGAIGDLHLVLKQEKVADDVVVVAGDNLFSQPLGDYGKLCRSVQAPVLGIYDVGSREQARKYGVVDVDDRGSIKSFIEKPAEPASSLIGIALYYYPKAILPRIDDYIQSGQNADQPGRLIQWLYPKLPVYTWKVPGTWFDIGSKETLEEADRVFRSGQFGR